MSKIYQPEGGIESDEDCEVYFLKPVNEYNIVDKIKEANKELFSGADDALDEDNVNAVGCSGSTDPMLSQQRKVTFALNLENYEPANSGDNANNNASGADDDQPAKAEKPLRGNSKFAAIEEEDAEIKANEDEIAVLVAEDKVLMMECSQIDGRKEQQQQQQERATDVGTDDVDEICEEIIVMDMENEGKPVGEASATQRRIFKQDTFDYDNKSLTNLLTSDYEEDGDDDVVVDGDEDDDDKVEDDDDDGGGDDKTATVVKDEDKKKLTNDTANNNNSAVVQVVAEEDEQYEEEDDTDNLSIIVASYIPDDFQCMRSASGERKFAQQNGKSRKLSFTKRFSFRRKSKGSPNAIAASHNPPTSSSGAGNCCMQPSMTSQRGHQHMAHLPPEALVTDLKLHYKTCCEYRNSTLDRLPRYTGYLSEYGLSREQLLQREQKLQQKQRYVLEQTLKTTEQEMRKMQDNERAFTTWLKNKMRYPINRTRNMFDARRKSKTPPPPPMPPPTMPSPFRRHCTGGCEATSTPSSILTPFLREHASLFKHGNN